MANIKYIKEKNCKFNKGKSLFGQKSEITNFQWK